jgi:hypothetical protein
MVAMESLRALICLVLLTLVSGEVPAWSQVVYLSPPDGTPVQGSDSEVMYWTRGYRFTAAKTFCLAEASLYVTLPPSTYIAARLYNAVGTLLASSAPVYGDGTEAYWHLVLTPSTLYAGSAYTIAFYSPDATNIPMDHRKSPTQPFSEDGWATDIYSRSTHEGDAFPTSSNSWAPVVGLYTCDVTDDIFMDGFESGDN